MNRFYNISLVAVLCLGISGLGASETQEKLSFMQSAKQKMKNTAGYYVKGCGVLHSLATTNAFVEAARGIECPLTLNTRFFGPYGKSVLEHAVLSNFRIAYFYPATAALVFGTALGIHAIKELPHALNVPYKTSESAKV